MPSRRTVLTAVATALAGCTAGPGVPPSSRTPSPSPPSSDRGSLTFDAVDVTDVPSSEPVLVVSDRWRRWLRRAADGETVRDSVRPHGCGRSPLEPVGTLGLADASDRTGSYDLTLETGGHFRYDLQAERAAPPDDATVHELSSMPDDVASGVTHLLDESAATFPSQSATYQFAAANSRESDEYQISQYVRRDDTSYRVFARIPTYTPACDYYVILGLSPAEAATPATTLSLAGPEGTDALARESGHDAVVRLSDLSAATRELVDAFDYVLTLTECYRLQVQN